MPRDWVVQVDDAGRVVVGSTDQPTDAYIVNPDAEGSLCLVERLDPGLSDAETPDDDGGLHADLGTASFLVCPAPDSTQQRYQSVQVVEPDPELVHRPDHEEQVEVRGSWTDSKSPSALDYWVIQNRDAHAMFRQRPSGRHHTTA